MFKRRYPTRKSKYYTPEKRRDLDDIVNELVTFIHEYFQTWNQGIAIYRVTCRFHSQIRYYGGDIVHVMRVLHDEGRIRILLTEKGARIVLPGLRNWSPPS